MRGFRWTLVALIAGVTCGVVRQASAGEPEAPAAVIEFDFPLLTKIPYVSRLFKNGDGACPASCPEACAEACPAGKVCVPFPYPFRFVGPDGRERIGVDFDCQLTGGEATCPPLRLPEDRPVGSPEANEVGMGEPHLGDLFAGMLEAVGGHAASEALLESQAEMFAALEEVRHESAQRERELTEQLVEARVAAATAKAQLKAQRAAALEVAKLAAQLHTAQLENAMLAAKLELAAEKEKLALQLQEAQLELVTLKAKSELTATKATPSTTSADAAKKKVNELVR